MENPSLSLIFRDIIRNLKYIDIRPYLYLNETKDKGYILQKKADGTNIAHILVDYKEEWLFTINCGISSL